MAIDGTGNLIIGNKIDERGLLVFGKFNEFGHFAKASIVTIILTETMNIVETLNRSVTRNFTESVNVAINVLRTINKMLMESVHIDEQTSREITRTYSIGVLISSSRTLKVTREFVEHLHILDIFKRYFKYIYTESVIISPSIGPTKFTRNMVIHIRALDTLSKKVTRELVESLNIIDQIFHIRVVAFIESVKVSIITTKKFTREVVVYNNISDILSKKFTREFIEVLTISEQLIRRWLVTLMEDVNISIMTTRKFTRILAEDVSISSIISYIAPFIMKKLYSTVKGKYRGAILKLQDGRDAK